MHLRDHPLITYNWPPVWVEKFGNTKLHGEIGQLTHLGNDVTRSTALFLHITHDGIAYCGSLSIEDSQLRSTIYDLLQTHIGHSIIEIADLALPHTP